MLIGSCITAAGLEYFVSDEPITVFSLSENNSGHFEVTLYLLDVSQGSETQPICSGIR